MITKNILKGKLLCQLLKYSLVNWDEDISSNDEKTLFDLRVLNQ